MTPTTLLRLSLSALRVGEEKEIIVQQLNVERRSYEERVEKLQKQMAAIIQEREHILLTNTRQKAVRLHHVQNASCI